nr:MAG TPA: hypothetical protein [Caudoviricetes sp.]
MRSDTVGCNSGKEGLTGRITGGESAFGISALLWICFRMQPEAGMTDRETRKK